MAVNPTPPISQNTPIVEKDGRPVAWFVLWLNALLKGSLAGIQATADAALAAAVSALAAVSGKADKTTTITGTGALGGGGDLSANRTITLNDTAVTPGTYGSSTKSAVITVDQKGRLTAASEATISAGSSINVKDEGSSIVNPASALNFVGAGVTVTNAGSGEATITIPGGSATVTASGVYTPVFTAVNNVSSIDPSLQHRWTRIGNVVTVSGAVQFTPTAGSAQCRLEMTLPVPSVFASVTSVAGSSGEIDSGLAGIVRTAVSSSTALLAWNAPNTSLRALWYVFCYTIEGSDQPHKWWRFEVTDTQGGGYPGLGELEFRQTVGVPVTASGGTPTVSSTLFGSAAAIFNGTVDAAWVANGYGPQWAQYEYATAVPVAEILVASNTAFFANEGPKNCKLYYSDDGVVFNLAKSFNAGGAWTSGETRLFTTP